MYCLRCRDERGPSTKFCVACGGPLEARALQDLERDLGQNLFLVQALEGWEKRGELTSKFAARLGEPYRARTARLRASLEVLKSFDADHEHKLVPEAPAPMLQPRVEPAAVALPAPTVQPSGDLAGAVRVDVMPAPALSPPTRAVNTVVAPSPEPEPGPLPRAADDAIALASGALEGPLSLADVESPPPAPLEALVERESSWGTVWKPFLYDNAIWFVGAFCIVSGSLYVASQAYTHVGDVARSLIVMGMMLAYAGGFGAAGFWLDAKKGLQSAGRILGLIGAAVAPVALSTIEPLRAAHPGIFTVAALGSLATATLLLRSASNRFDPRLSLRLAGVGLVLMAWELLVPLATAEPGLAVLVPLGALLAATPVLRPRDPGLERPAQAFAGLMLLYLAAFDIVRLHVLLSPSPGLELYGPVAAALGWIALRADRARLGPSTDAQPKLEPTSLAALALVVGGGLCALVAEASAAAAALLATLAFADAARTYRRAPFVAVAAFLGLFAYYLSPDLIPHGVTLVIAAAKHALGYPESQPLPIAYAGISTVPYLVALGILARRAHAKGQRWVARPLGFTGAALAAVLAVVSHTSGEVRPGLWTSVALLLLAGAALWLAEHAAAGYLFGALMALLGSDLVRAVDAGRGGLALGLALSAMALLAVAQLAPERQRPGLVGEALVMALLAPLAALDGWQTPRAPGAFLAGAVLLLLLALQTRSRLPAFLAALELTAAGAAVFALPAPPTLATPVMLGLALLAVLGSGLSARPAAEASPGILPFGMRLSWPARGLDVVRDPLALLAGGLALVALAPVGRHLVELVAVPSALQRAELVAGAVIALLLARRQAAGPGAMAGVLLAALACAGVPWALALLGLASALLAVAFTLWPDTAQASMRTEGDAATLPFALAALLLPASVAAVGSHAPLAVGAVSMVLLLRWKPTPALWLPLASVCGWWACAPLDAPITAHASASIALGLAALGLFARELPGVAEPLLGAEADTVPPVTTWLVPLASLLALSELSLGGAAGMAHRAIVPLALLAAAYLVLARQTEHAVPLFVGAGLAVSSAMCLFPEHVVGIALGCALGFALVANALRVVSAIAERGFGVYPARTAGYALGLLALLLLGVPALAWLAWDAPLTELTPAYPLIAAAVTFLAARALGWAPLHPLAIALALGELLHRTGLHAHPTLPLWINAGGALMLALAVLTRRFPGAMALTFLDRPPEKGRADLLRGSLLAAMGLAVLLAPCLADFDHATPAVLASAVTGSALLLTLAPLAAPGAGWWVFAAVVALCGSLAIPASDDFKPSFLAAHVLLGIAGLLQLRSGRRMALRALAATDASGQTRERVRDYRRAFTGTVACGLLLGAMGFVGTLFERIDARNAVQPAAAFVSVALAITGLHLVFRRRSPWTLALALALPLLPVAYLAPPELLAPALALAAVPLAALAWVLPLRGAGRLLSRVGLAMHLRRRQSTAQVAFIFLLGLAVSALAATRLELSAWQTPATAGLLTCALVLASMRQRTGRILALGLLPATAHLGLAWLGIQLSSGRPHEAILGAWALASALLALGCELFAGERAQRSDVRAAAHLYFALGAAELTGALALMPGMRPSELLLSGLAAALLGTFALRRALATGREAYAYLAQGALVALYLLVRLQTEFVGRRGDRDALSTVLLGFAFLGLHALARRVQSEVFERPTRVVTHVLPLLGLLFVPQLTAAQGTAYGLGLALHYAAVSGVTGGSKLAATLSAIALNAALAVTWIDRGIADPQFYAIPFGATLLAFARIFRAELSDRARFGLRTAGILCVYVASATSALYFASASYVLVCAAVCVFGVLLGVALRVKSYVYLGSAFLVVDVLGNMARYGLRQPFLGGLFLTLLGFALVGGWIFFVSKREELLRRYQAVQTLLADWE